MAKTWSVTPSDGVTGSDGSYTFPANDTYDDKVYTVTLKDTDCNCVAHKTIKVKGKSAPTACTCSITSDYGTTSSKISGDQHTNVKIGTFTSYLCSGTTTFSYNSGDADFVSNFSYTGNDIYADVSSNVSTTNSRMAIYNASCGGSLTIYQASAEEVCPTQSSDIINTTTTVANTGGTQVEVMQILKDSTYTAYTITATSTSSSYVSNINQGAHLHDNWYVVLADVTANPNLSDRSLYFDVVVEGPTLGSGCTYNNVTVTQNAGCPTVYYHGSTIPAEGSSMGLPLMYWSPSDDYPLNTFSVSYTGDGITSTEFITSSSLIPGQTVNVLLVKFSANTGTSSRTFNVHLSTSVSSDCTWDNTYTQNGATPTCGCNSITYSGTYEADPTPDDGKIKLSVDSISGNWTPAIEFHTSNNTNLMSVNTYNASTVVVKDWANVGTCSKIKFTQIRGSYTKIGVSIDRGDSFVTLLSNATIPSSGKYLNLLTNFNVSDYSNSSNCTLKITFR